MVDLKMEGGGGGGGGGDGGFRVRVEHARVALSLARPNCLRLPRRL